MSSSRRCATRMSGVRLMAAALVLERGYGRPERKSDVGVVHHFVEAPQVMEQAEWLKHRGQPQLAPPKDDPDRKLS